MRETLAALYRAGQRPSLGDWSVVDITYPMFTNPRARSIRRMPRA